MKGPRKSFRGLCYILAPVGKHHLAVRGKRTERFLLVERNVIVFKTLENIGHQSGFVYIQNILPFINCFLVANGHFAQICNLLRNSWLQGGIEAITACRQRPLRKKEPAPNGTGSEFVRQIISWPPSRSECVSEANRRRRLLGRRRTEDFSLKKVPKAVEASGTEDPKQMIISWSAGLLSEKCTQACKP